VDAVAGKRKLLLEMLRCCFCRVMLPVVSAGMLMLMVLLLLLLLLQVPAAFCDEWRQV
jgi:hypothetical protein